MNMHKPSTVEDQISQVWDVLIGNGSDGLYDGHLALVKRFDHYMDVGRIETCPVLGKERMAIEKKMERRHQIGIGITVGTVILVISILFGWLGPKINTVTRQWESVRAIIEEMERRGD